MNLPSLYDYNRWIDVGVWDKRPYLERYLGAKQMSTVRQAELARLAFNLVQAQFRLSDITQTIALDNNQRVAAQECEIHGWHKKADRFISDSPGTSLHFQEMINDFSVMATEARKPDDAERNFIALGLSGRIGEVVTEPVTEPYSWEDPQTAWDSGLNEVAN